MLKKDLSINGVLNFLTFQNKPTKTTDPETEKAIEEKLRREYEKQKEKEKSHDA